MAILIGTDEAGYGPNYGPLLVAASAWRVPDGCAEFDLYERLRGHVAREANAEAVALVIADSKQLYVAGGSLTGLEEVVLAALLTLQRQPRSWRTMWHAIAPCSQEKLAGECWCEGYDEAAPVDGCGDSCLQLSERFTAALLQAEVALTEIRAVPVFPAEFNRRVHQLGSKGALLTETTLRLAAQIIEQHPGEAVHVFCDKHGGRNHYAAALQHIWPDSWVQVLKESRAQSVYRLSHACADVQFEFNVGGESHCPTALASMTAKYLRELAMRAFNAFWQKHVPDLKPTAGYPGDALRFKKDIAKAQKRLKIDDALLWRCK
jgi:ribonuclease HII